MDSKVIEIVAGLAKFRQIPLSVKVNEAGNSERTIRGVVKWFSDRFMLLGDFSGDQEHRIDYLTVGKIDVMKT